MAREQYSAANILAFAPVVAGLVFAVTYAVNMFCQFYVTGVELYLRQYSEPVRLQMVFSFTCGLPIIAFFGMLLWAYMTWRRRV